MSHYAMTKTAMISIAKSLANEAGRDCITMNSISPGSVILTPFCGNVLPGQDLGQPENESIMVLDG